MVIHRIPFTDYFVTAEYAYSVLETQENKLLALVVCNPELLQSEETAMDIRS